MKKIFIIITLFLLTILIGCTIEDNYENTFILPDLSNKTKSEIEKIFIDAPITIVIKDVINYEVESGIFLEYGNNLKASDEVKYGEVIYIYFACKETVILPNLTNKDKSEIEKIMADLELSVQFEYIDSNIVKDNYFISYGNNLNIGDELEKTTSVKVFISREYINLPDLSDKNLDEIESIMDNYNLNVIYKEVENDEIENGLFVSYGNGLEIGSKVYLGHDVIIYISKFVGKYKLPDLSNLNKNEIKILLEDLGYAVDFYEEINNSLDDGTFIRYMDYDIDDLVKVGNKIVVIIAKNLTTYYEPLDLYYDGPRIDSKYINIDPVDPRGGYFEVTLSYCVDGDTAKFNYPDYIENIIGQNGSVRFLNMDTEETYPDVEEWGLAGKYFTCDLLENAESIIIQTDPDDDLTDHYNRLLGWIWIIPDDTEFYIGETEYLISQYELLNYKVVQQGLAKVAYLYGAGKMKYEDKSYTEWMYMAQDYAIRHELGQWSDLKDPYFDY